MSRTLVHEIAARPRTDDAARQRWVLALKTYLGRHVRPANEMAYEARAKPRFTARTGHAPAGLADIAAAMADEPITRVWSALHREAQEQMWFSMAEMIDADQPRMTAAARALSENPGKKGSLDLDPDFVIPAYVTLRNIHCQPGGYGLDRGDQDLAAGALYESGGNLYSQGAGIGIQESKAHRVVAYIAERFPDLSPKRILDMGCSAGGQTVPYAMLFEDAEVHGIDVAPAMLRYGHARAESLGVAVHFHQMDAQDLGFEDESFDLVVSHNMFHETAAAAVPAILKESRRVLRPGGLLLNQDVPIRADSLSDFAQFMSNWETRYNNEPYWTSFARMDSKALLRDAGFDAARIIEDYIPMVHGASRWYVFGGRKSA